MDYSTIAGMALLGFAAWTQRDTLLGLVGKATGKADTSRAEAIAALDTVIVYYEKSGCVEGAKAARAVGPHFWHEADEVTG